MPCPPPQSGLSKERSRSRLAVSENTERVRSMSDRLMVCTSLSGATAPLWQESVSSTFHFALILPKTDPSVAIGYAVFAIWSSSMS